MELLFEYLGLCWFRNDPNDLVPPKSFMWKVIAFYLAVGMIVEGLIADVEGVIEVWLRITMAFSSISVFLLVKKKWSYFGQLFTAIFVGENLIMTLAVAVETLYFYMVRTHKPYYEETAAILGVILVIWYLGIVAYILRKLFDVETLQSWIFAFSYFVLTYGIPMMFMDM